MCGDCATDYLCKMSANHFKLDFLGFKIQDRATGAVFFQVRFHLNSTFQLSSHVWADCRCLACSEKH
jgi:hypothetical protein